MIVNIFNELFTVIKTTLNDCTVLAEYPSTPPDFPCVIVSELSNNTYVDTVDTSGEQHNDITFEINIFSNAPNKTTQVRDIKTRIDNILAGTYRMTRDDMGAVPNYADTNIYRHIVRYSGIVDSNKKIHRG